MVRETRRKAAAGYVLVESGEDYQDDELLAAGARHLAAIGER